MKSKLVLLTSLLFASQAAVFGQTTVEPWQIHEGNEGIIDHPTNNTQDFLNAFAKAKIPTTGWRILTPDNNGTVSFNQPSKITRGKQQVDFTYFKAIVNVKGPVNEFKVTMGNIDDAARIYINGQYVQGSDIIGSQTAFKTIDFSKKVKQGRNEVVIVQFDQHPPGNTIKDIGLEVNGKKVKVPGTVKVTPWQIHQGNSPEIIDFETKTLAQRKAAFAQAKIPSPADRGWKPAEIRKDGSVIFQKPSQVKKEAGQSDFTFFQTIVTAPKEGITKFQVQFDLVDDGARIYLFNKKFPAGHFVAESDVYRAQHKLTKVDFTNQIVEGENRVVVVQFDQNRPGNTLMGLRLQVTD